MFKFQKLKVWNKAVDYSTRLFQIADQIPGRYQFSFGDQLRRAALSITNNIAEGAGRTSKKESNYFFNISKGSVYETINILIMMSKIGILEIEEKDKQAIYRDSEEICRMLTGLMRNK